MTDNQTTISMKDGTAILPSVLQRAFDGHVREIRATIFKSVRAPL